MIIFCLVVAFTGLAAAQPPSLIPLRVAICFEEPIEGLALADFTKEGKPIGYLPDLAAALAHYLGRPLRILPYSRAELYTSLERSEADIVIDPGSPPLGLGGHLALSQPWSASSLAVLAPRAVPADAISGVLTPDRLPFPPDFIMVPSTFLPFKALGHQSGWRMVADLPAGLAEVLKAQGERAAGAPAARPISSDKPWPCLILPLREALLLNRKYPTETRVLGALPHNQDSWQIAMSANFAQDGAEPVNQFITQFREEKGFEDLERQHLQWETEQLLKLSLPSYANWLSKERE